MSPYASALREFVLRPVRHLLTLPGTGDWRDQLILRVWDGYAWVRSARVGGRAATGTLPIAQQSRASGPTYDAAFFRDHLATQLLPFWAEHALDREHGGYITHLDRQGRVYENELKLSAMQARLIYSFVAGYEALGAPAYLEAAQHGLRFMREHLWDDEHGGWLASVHRNGRPHASHKWLFDQSYALLAMAEYHRVTGDETAREHAARTYALLEAHAWDQTHGGYFESRERDWSKRSNDKTACVQLDMLSALLRLHTIAPDPGVLGRIGELADTVLGMRDPRRGLVLERFRENWVYQPVPVLDQLVLGHSLKSATLLLRAARLSKRADLTDAARKLVEASLAYGWDRQHGGFYQFIYRSGVLADSIKQWWAECAGLQALTLLHQITGDGRYDGFYRELADFTFAHFADGEYGDWFASCYPNGDVHNPVKGYTYKTAFHPVEVCCDMMRYRSPQAAPA